jgi:hypothetical protein
MAKQVRHRGGAVNSILPTAIEGAGVFTEGAQAEFRDFINPFLYATGGNDG